jgi:hypothetical protein
MAGAREKTMLPLGEESMENAATRFSASGPSSVVIATVSLFGSGGVTCAKLRTEIPAISVAVMNALIMGQSITG